MSWNVWNWLVLVLLTPIWKATWMDKPLLLHGLGLSLSNKFRRHLIGTAWFPCEHSAGAGFISCFKPFWNHFETVYVVIECSKIVLNGYVKGGNNSGSRNGTHHHANLDSDLKWLVVLPVASFRETESMQKCPCPLSNSKVLISCILWFVFNFKPSQMGGGDSSWYR